MAQADLAVELGDRYNRQMVSHVENGRSSLLFDGAVRAARVLGVSLDWLAGLTDDHRPAAELSRLLLAHGGPPAPPLVAQAKGGHR